MTEPYKDHMIIGWGKCIENFKINVFLRHECADAFCLLAESSLCHFFVRDKEMAERKRVRRFPPADPHLRRTPPFGAGLFFASERVHWLKKFNPLIFSTKESCDPTMIE